MHLLLLNGSPRGERGNSNFLLQVFLEGFNHTPGHTHELVHLNRVSQHRHYAELFATADAVVMAFPLYTDMMPGVVKAFIDELEPLCGHDYNPALGFIIQSGFPEAVQLRALEAYLEKLSRRLGCRYLGTALKGGGEGIQSRPRFTIRDWLKNVRAIGRSLGVSGGFDSKAIARMARPERLSPLAVFMTAHVGERFIRMFFWDRMMKANGVHERRLARPYAEPPVEWREEPGRVLS